MLPSLLLVVVCPILRLYPMMRNTTPELELPWCLLMFSLVPVLLEQEGRVLADASSCAKLGTDMMRAEWCRASL